MCDLARPYSAVPGGDESRQHGLGKGITRGRAGMDFWDLRIKSFERLHACNAIRLVLRCRDIMMEITNLSVYNSIGGLSRSTIALIHLRLIRPVTDPSGHLGLLSVLCYS